MRGQLRQPARGDGRWREHLGVECGERRRRDHQWVEHRHRRGRNERERESEAGAVPKRRGQVRAVHARQRGVPQFPDPRTSVPPTPGGLREGFGEITDFDGAILVSPATINLQAPAYKQALTACRAPPLGLPLMGTGVDAGNPPASSPASRRRPLALAVVLLLAAGVVVAIVFGTPSPSPRATGNTGNAAGAAIVQRRDLVETDIRSQPGSRTEVSPGVRGHTPQRAHAPPTTRRNFRPRRIETLDTSPGDK
jgi:hypothetical protein